MCNSLLSVVRQITSSRQSPRISALNAGVALVPLFEAHSSAFNNTVSVLSTGFHFEITLRSSSSLSTSPSHQIPNLHDRGVWSEIFSPFAFQRPLSPAPRTQLS